MLGTIMEGAIKVAKDRMPGPSGCLFVNYEIGSGEVAYMSDQNKEWCLALCHVLAGLLREELGLKPGEAPKCE